MRRYLILAAIALAASAGLLHAQTNAPLSDHVIAEYGTPPLVPQGQLSPQVMEALNDVVGFAVDQSAWRPTKTEALETIAQAKDPRVIWLLTDIQRFTWRTDFRNALTDVAAEILDTPFEGWRHREEIINKMIAWDMPSYPGYLDHKRRVFTNYVPGWEDIFAPGDIDWHLVDWGGVNIDARPYDTTDEICDCIPATDNPRVSTAAQATWLKDDDVVFGLVVNGEARAYPRRIMEIREMVNDTLGGRDLGIPYCTLCGAAQAYFTDVLPAGVKRPILRTTGLLIRSNKVMYDLETNSVFDTFFGRAVTGPLADAGLTLPRATLVTTDWGTWRQSYPQTTVLVEDLALGRDFNLRETRDAKGPIFPVGDVDPRLTVHEDVIGALTADGTPVAFPRARAVTALRAGQQVRFADVTLELFAGGVRAVGAGGVDLGSHEAFWFAWSQFHPDTVVWDG